MIHELLRNFIAGNILRRHSCYLHSYVLQACLDLIVYYICVCNYENTDASAAVDVGYNTSVLSAYLLESSDVQVFSDHCDLLNQSILYCLGSVCCPCLCHECIHVSCIGISDLIYNRLNKSLELIVLCNEVCLRVYLNDRCQLIISDNSLNDTLCGNSSGLLLCLSLSVLSQELNSGIHRLP